jgi:hypothetical protein
MLRKSVQWEMDGHEDRKTLVATARAPWNSPAELAELCLSVRAVKFDNVTEICDMLQSCFKF